MKITTHHADGVTTISLAGDLDMSTAPSLQEQVAAAAIETRPQGLIIDATQLEFCDAAGIQALVLARRDAIHHGIAFRLTNAHGITRRILQLTGVLDALTGTPGRA
ncbi:STAS domain-containing protein [Nucisporomicrobium flavum]|uniref:STAS domain-containing protein n=1 Tax=Nucisporomicrobium flavum TaxID=2785915 RepID=UPI003C2DF4BA